MAEHSPEERDLVEEELQALLTGDVWDPTVRGSRVEPVRFEACPHPTLHAVVAARHGDQIRKRVYYPQLDEMDVTLVDGRTIKYNHAGDVLCVTYPGTRGLFQKMWARLTRRR